MESSSLLNEPVKGNVPFEIDAELKIETAEEKAQCPAAAKKREKFMTRQREILKVQKRLMDRQEKNMEWRRRSGGNSPYDSVGSI